MLKLNLEKCAQGTKLEISEKDGMGHKGFNAKTERAIIIVTKEK